MERTPRDANASWVFLGMVVIGAVVPIVVILPWVSQHGLDAPRFVEELLRNRVSAFFAWDVVISALVVLIAAFATPGLSSVQRLVVGAGTLLIGVSCGLPLLLFFWTRQGILR